MADLIVVVPGILGSVLEKDNKEVWALSGQSISSYIRSFGSSLSALQIIGDDGDAPDLGDGIKATKLISDTHIVPGLWKIDGYSELTRSIRNSFEVQATQNYIEFPYDWRRDNAVAARSLASLIQDRLTAWRLSSGNQSAKVILIAHSMGGLIARYYIEVMQGWKECRALITFGTPYRGAIKALDYLFNGYKLGWINLSSFVESCTSVYQLLPTYPSINTAAGVSLRADSLPASGGFSSTKAKAGRAFHEAISSAVEENLKQPEYRRQFTLLPVVGVSQPTMASAFQSKSGLVASEDLPSGLDRLMMHGDGTVPLVSAIPFEMNAQFTMPFYPETHGSLQNNPQVLTELIQWLRQSQVQGLENFRTALPSDLEPLVPKPSFRLRVQDAYPVGEPVRLSVETSMDLPPTARVIATIYPIRNDVEPIRQDLLRDNTGWATDFHGLPEGCYRLRISARCPKQAVLPPPLSDVFLVNESP